MSSTTNTKHRPGRPRPVRAKVTTDQSGGYESVFRSVLTGYLDDGLPPALAYSRAATSTFRFAVGISPGDVEGLRTRTATEIFEARGLSALRSGFSAEDWSEIRSQINGPEQLRLPRPALREERVRRGGSR